MNDKLNGFYNKGDDKRYSIIQNVDTKERYYLMNDNYLSKLRGAQKIQWLIETVNKLGYKEYKSDDRYDENFYVKSKTSVIKLDVFTYSVLKDNPNFIAELDADQGKLANLAKQSIQHSNKLDSYLSTYNVKKSRMSTADLTAWRAATKQADVLNMQMYKISEKYAGNYSITPIDKSYHSTISNFADNLLASKGVLGM
jgi:hypothetical protein